MGKLNKSLFSSNNQTWETPIELFNNLNATFNFELDVCATDETAKCNVYFTPKTDGLKQKWGDVLHESSLWQRTGEMDSEGI